MLSISAYNANMTYSIASLTIVLKVIKVTAGGRSVFEQYFDLFVPHQTQKDACFGFNNIKLFFFLQSVFRDTLSGIIIKYSILHLCYHIFPLNINQPISIYANFIHLHIFFMKYEI